MRILSMAATLAVVFVIQGCAGSVGSMIKESDKDASFSFDGNYTTSVKDPGGRQDMGPGWSTNCSAQEFTGAISVANSEVQWRWDKDTVVTGFVNADGKFRLEHPLSDENNAKGNGSMLSDGSMTVILQGDLSEDVMKGLIVYGIAQFTNRGCTYPVKYAAR